MKTNKLLSYITLGVLFSGVAFADVDETNDNWLRVSYADAEETKDDSGHRYMRSGANDDTRYRVKRFNNDVGVGVDADEPRVSEGDTK